MAKTFRRIGQRDVELMKCGGFEPCEPYIFCLFCWGWHLRSCSTAGQCEAAGKKQNYGAVIGEVFQKVQN